MELELIIYVITPILIALFVLFFSFKTAIKNSSIPIVLLSITAIFLTLLSIYSLVMIWLGAYPTYTPHIFILISAIIILVQKLIIK